MLDPDACLMLDRILQLIDQVREMTARLQAQSKQSQCLLDRLNARFINTSEAPNILTD